MNEKRKLSIGITVNLENYENLKVEVEDICDEEDDAEELIAYLDSVLFKLGRADPDTKNKIDSYRRRVLESPGEHMINEFGQRPPDKVPGIREDNLKKDPLQKNETPVPGAGPTNSESTVKDQSGGDTEFTCSACSSPISKAEEQLSQIFMGRSLCKKCLEEMQK